jgi:membrane protein
MEMKNNLSNESLINEDNSNNSNADNNLNQPTDNVDNNNDNNITKFKTISDFFLDSFGIVSIVSALIYIYLYIVAYSKSSYYNIPIKYFYSNSEKVKPIIYTVCIFLIILPHLRNLKYKIIEENIVVVSSLSTIFSFIGLVVLFTYTIDKPTNILTKIMFVMGLIIVGLYVKLNKERVSIIVCIVIAIIIIFAVICLKEKINLNLLPISLMFVFVIWNKENINIFMPFVKIICIILLSCLLLYLSLYLNNIMAEIAVYGDKYEVIEVGVKENSITYKVIMAEYNDSFIIMDGTSANDVLTIDNSKFEIIDKNNLDGYICYKSFKDTTAKFEFY